MSLDPWRTLGLAPGAGEDEIKRAYRRLAKEHHPDAGGPGALPHFLAIQSAYEMLMSGRVRGAAFRSGATHTSRRGHEGAPPAGGPWSADPARARATREAWSRAGGRRRWAGQGSTGGQSRGTAGQTGPAGADRPAGAGGSAGGAGDAGRPGSEPGGPRPGSRARPRTQRIRKATPGSTTYDEAHLEPDEPGWTGSAWYGQASGTYWTINPREYADPRKHGPDYQARARRAVPRPGSPGGTAPPETDATRERDAPREGPAPGRGAAAPRETGAPRETVRTSRGAAAPHRAPGPGRGSAAHSAPRPDPASSPSGASAAAGRTGERAASPPTSPSPSQRTQASEPVGREASGLLGLPWLVRRIVGAPDRRTTRLGLAIAAWPPLGVAALLIVGELTGCARSAATCPGLGALAAWSLAAQGCILAVLMALPTLARLGAVGTLVALIAAVPGVAVLTALGASHAPDGGSAALLWLLGLAYLAGAVIGWRAMLAEKSTRRGGAGRVGSPS